MEIILASKSRARREILENCGFKVKVVASDVRESKGLNRSFSHTVKVNALRKLKDVSKKVKTGVIVSADTLVFRKNFVFGKPRDLKDAKRILKKLSRRPHWVYTGIAVLDKGKNKLLLDYEKTRVYMHNLSDKEIKQYFSRNNPLGFAGAFDIQGQGGLYIRRIEGCFYNVVGLPLAKLYYMLRKIGLLIFLFIFSINIFGCTEFNPVTQKQEMILYSTDREVNIGKNISQQVEKDYELVKDPLVIERVNRIADKITAVSDRKDIAYHVALLKAKDEEKEIGADVNAFALPGGYIYVYDGLINFVDNDDELASVIAHEVGHIVAKHSIKKLQALMGYTLMNLAAMGIGDANLAGGANYAFINILLGYSREDELLADTLGVRYAKLAGYNPRAMIDFLEKLRKKTKDEPIKPKSEYRTHPYIADRIVTVKKELGEPLTFSDYVNTVNE
ncbi:MAG: Maf and M48 domain-containing protein [Candidatus Omnitrophica bacterium]|nr:Maf and M48 domain-containing protein [Candidatus Omnitrophota bacterium]MDD5351954.1 Maf and M48 domain-containing protein [Candidatus Omnitrophota bacterium]MDD5550780.1 Maf and M48 domain-containing protein [Candidatus Omnitrophota bacterium]